MGRYKSQLNFIVMAKTKRGKPIRDKKTGRIIKGVAQDTNKNGTAGAPPRYSDPETLQASLDAYFEYCDNRIVKETTINPRGQVIEIEIKRPIPYTVSGLALWLGFTSRNAILNYEDKPEFLGPIKRAKLRIEQQLEGNLALGKHAAGIIFNLKNNYGWKDAKELDVTTQGQKLGYVALPEEKPIKK